MNPIAIAQSAIALTIAISCTDAVREVVLAAGPKTVLQTAVFKVAAVVVLILLAMMLISWIGTNAGSGGVSSANVTGVTPHLGSVPSYTVTVGSSH
jgi:hypothetical protein